MEARCHTSLSADPVLAVADSEGGINLVRWSTSEVFLFAFKQRAAHLTPRSDRRHCSRKLCVVRRTHFVYP